MTSEWIAGIAAMVISLLLEVVPGLADWWGTVDETYKRLGWLVACLVIPLVVLAAGCAGLDLGVVAPSCDVGGVVEALKMGFAAYFAGQLTYAVAGKVARQARAKRRGYLPG